MVNHIVMWKFKDEVPQEERLWRAKEMEAHLNTLADIVPGMVAASFVTMPLNTSTHDIALLAQFEDEAALKGYTTHPEHMKIANTYVRPYVCNRACLDY